MVQPIGPEIRPRLSGKARVQTDKITSKPALLYPEGVLLLNPTGAAIIELCDGRHTVTEMIAELAARYNSPVDRLSREIPEYLQRLHDRGLLEGMQESLP